MLQSSRAHRPILAGLAAAGLVLALAACGGDSGSSGDGGASAAKTATNGDVFNSADVDFATSMIPHHAQAIQMVVLTDGRTLDPEVKGLADAIREAQAPEVEAMVDWLTAWGEEVPETSMDHANGDHDMSEMPDMGDQEDLPGMMSSDEMEALMDAPEADFQDMWLEMMKEHHAGAIEMAKAEQAEGEFPDAIDLANSIESSQTAEIDQIDRLLDS